MADIKGTNIASPVAPFTTDDAYPTHYAKYGNGGYKEVATITDRDAIPLSRLEDGCIVYVKADNTEYRWIDNDWEVSSIDLSEYVKEDENGNVDITGKLTINGKDLPVENGDGEYSLQSNLCDAAGLGSIALGATKRVYPSVAYVGASATEQGAICLGGGAYASQQDAICIGAWSECDGIESIVIGGDSYCYGDQAVVVGPMSEADGFGSTAIGCNTYANDDYSTAIGYSLNTSADSQLVLGTFNANDATKTIIIGNGTGSRSKHNILTVDDNNNVDIDGSLSIANKLTVNDELSVNGDIKWSKDGEMQSISDLSDKVDSRLATDLSNIDEAGMKKIQDIAIFDPFETMVMELTFANGDTTTIDLPYKKLY